MSAQKQARSSLRKTTMSMRSTTTTMRRITSIMVRAMMQMISGTGEGEVVICQTSIVSVMSGPRRQMRRNWFE